MTDDQSRRGFLAVAGAGTAVAASAALLGGAGAAGATQHTASTQVPAEATTPLVAYVRDAHTGEVCVMVDDREVVVHDKELAARIARVAHGGM
jgi:FlaG/FlaF family flagellin (archaellin)